jgi:hypothetical protein
MRSDKKFIVKVVAGRSSLEVLEMMKNLASLLYNSHNIPIVSMFPNKCEFSTPNCTVRYVIHYEKLVGLKPDEIFGCDPELRARRRKPSNTLPYEGGILEYILEVEKAADEQAKNEEKKTDLSGEYDILEFLEKVMGLELSECQKDMVKTFKRIHDAGCKVVYGRGGKIYVVPVEDKED